MTEGVFSHKDTKFHYARVLLHPTPSGAPSRREPSFDLCEHLGRARYVRKTFLYGSFCGAFFQKSDPNIMVERTNQTKAPSARGLPSETGGGVRVHNEI